MTVVAAFLVVACVGLAIALRAVKCSESEAYDMLWASTWAGIHAVNGTVPQNKQIAEELEEMRACAADWLDAGYPEDAR